MQCLCAYAATASQEWLGEEAVGGAFSPIPCWCLTLSIRSDNNHKGNEHSSHSSPSLSTPQLTICYLDMLMTSEERRKQLRDQYCFECDCIRCQTHDKVCGWKTDWNLPWCLEGLSGTSGAGHAAPDSISKYNREQAALFIFRDFCLWPRWEVRSLGLRVSWEYRR